MILASVLAALLSAQPPPYVDVALVEGKLIGQTEPNTEVRCYQKDKLIQAVQSTSQGDFALSLRPGVYLVETARGYQMCRVWFPGAAPPSSIPLIIRGQEVRSVPGLDVLTQRAIIVGGIGIATWVAIDSAS